MGSTIECIKEQKRVIIRQHSKSSNLKGLTQVATTFGSLVLWWWVAAMSVGVSAWLTVGSVLLISLFTLRVFALMHECGHGSLFHSQRFNRGFGFLLGVAAGMPQYVWSQHHNFHHTHNGNWQKYRGPYTTLSVDEYAALTAVGQRMYRCKCSILGAPIAGFIYLIFNPRFTWLKGSAALVAHLVRQKVRQPSGSLKVQAASFKTRYWNSAREYRHMFWNNIVLLSIWVLLCYVLGAALFFKIYLISLSLAGGAGIVLFTVQHNFRHSYASDGKHWDYDIAAIEGTSFLILPAWLNWFTANIGYHHIHHLSSRIPNYCLIGCHDAHRQLFSAVTRVRLEHVCGALQYILWDTRARQLISVAEYLQLTSAAR
ncbi:MAG TPA: fatty acid desaturase [Steroidobacteraceae bacterium]